MSWNPQVYLSFAEPRLRPALDLLGHIQRVAAAQVVDLGCGPGNVTPFLRRRFPEAQIVGIDASPAMLDRARATAADAGTSFIEGDIAAWQPARPVDLIFSNAALHWLDDHAGLFAHLVAQLAPGGTLAVQMPRNHQAPSHRAIAEAAAAGPWATTLQPLLRPAPVGTMADYYRHLAGRCAGIDIWETEYLHVLSGDNPVVAWTKGTVLAPLLGALPPDQAAGFEAAYADRIARAYPPQADGRTLFPFRRLFIVATR